MLAQENMTDHRCPRCNSVVPHHGGGCSVPGELDMMERVQSRIRGRSDRADLASRIEFYLHWFMRR